MAKDIDDALSTLPLDILIQILKKLPAKSLLKLRLVSKHFKALISNPYFLQLHLSAAATSTASAADRHHVIHFESTDNTKGYFSFRQGNPLSLCKTLETPFQSVNGYLRVVGSSKGVICLFDTNYFTFVGSLILWNPFIGKFKILPFMNELNCVGSNSSSFHMVVGFGFDRRTVDFKAIKILYDSDHEYMSKALIYRSKTSSWNRIDLEVPCYMPITWSSSVFVNSVVHWLAYTWETSSDNHPNCVMGFDVAEETFNSIELPRNLDPNVKEIRLSHLDRKSLTLFVSYHGNVGELWDIWFMRDYGNVESWTLHNVVSMQEVFFPLRMLKDDSVLVVANDGKLMFIDMENEVLSVSEACGSPLSFYADDYVPTLALLDSGDQLPGLRESADDFVPTLALLDGGDQLPGLREPV